MRFRLPMLAAVATGALALPGAATAQTSSYDAVPEVGCVGAGVIPSAKTQELALDATLCLVNEERTSRGLGRLSPVGSLESVAAAYAARMVRQRFFEHTAPDGSTLVTRIKRTSYLGGGLRRWSIGENIAWGSGRLATPEAIVAAWMRSPGHRRNILNRSFHELGLGIAIGAPKAGFSRNAATYVNEFGQRRR